MGVPEFSMLNSLFGHLQ